MKTSSQFLTRLRPALCLALVLMGLGAPASLRAASRWETLEAIHHIENPRNTTAPGRYGELGAYQFRNSTWRMHTTEPFERALHRPTAEAVAVQHYEWLRRGLVRNGLPPTPYNIALAWNGGLTAAVRGRASASAHEYADRVNNIVAQLSAARVAANP